jgi:hypothetical protein
MARLGRGQPNRPLVTRLRTTGPATGDLVVSGAATITLAGTAHRSGALTVTGSAAVTISGTASTSIGVPPRPRIRWQLILGSAAGGHELALTEATSRKYTAKLTEPSEMAFSIDGLHPQAAEIESLTTDVHLLWTSGSGATRILDRCRVGNQQDALDGTSHRLQVHTLDYREVLAGKILYAGDQLTWTATDQAEIAFGLIQQTQAQNSGSLGIVKGWAGTTPTGQMRDRTYEAGDSIGQRIQELSEVLGGFDWDITPTSASGLRLDVWHPERGTDRGVVLEYGGLVVSATRDLSATDYVNSLRYTGGGDPPPAPVEFEAAELDPALGGLVQGRWEKAYGDDGLRSR